MPEEIRKYDTLAKILYDNHRKKGWPLFEHLKRKERDRWRGLAQIAKEENLWQPID